MTTSLPTPKPAPTLIQAIVCILFFYGYGLGLFGQAGMAMGMSLILLVYLLQSPFSHWSLKRNKYRPAQWLWRSLAYLKPQPMKQEG